MRYNKPEFIVLHTAAYSGDASIQLIDSWHRQCGFVRSSEFLRAETSALLAFQSIAFHWLVSKSGDVTRGRFEDEPTELYKDDRLNHSAISICFEGHGDYERFSQSQETQLIEILARICRQYPDIYRGGTSRLIGHREIPGEKHTCPGTKNSMNFLRQIFLERVISARADSMPELEYITLDELEYRRKNNALES